MPKPSKRGKEVVSVPRLNRGVYVAMDSDGTKNLFAYKPEPSRAMWNGMWMGCGGIFTGLPRIPKSQWDKHLYRVGTSGQLVRVGVE